MLSFLKKEKISNLGNIFNHLQTKYQEATDPWGLRITSAKKYIQKIFPLYKSYFQVRVTGQENVEDKQYMIISNHSGQIAIDGLMIGMAFALEVWPPRIVRPMVERFFTSLPFINKWSNECGAVLGDRENCHNLIERGESLLIFPEGVKGVAKSTPDFYKLQPFTKGFYRMALEGKIEILPVAVIGAEETFPFVYQAKGLAKKFGLPAAPISANYFPLPSPIDIHIGKPIKLDLSKYNSDSSDHDLNAPITEIENIIQQMIDDGLKNRRDFIFKTKAKK